MSIRLPLTVAIGATLFLSGCAETSALGSAVSQTVNSVVTGTVNGIQEGISQAGNQNSGTQSRTMPNSDMYNLFGWMEDGCMGDSNAVYQKIRNNYSQFTDSFVQTVEVAPTDPRASQVRYIVKPKNQWPTGYQNLIKDIVVSTPDNFDITYKVIFKDTVKYRGQPLDTFSFQFTSGTEGSQQVLNFDSSANMATVFSNFRTRQYEPHWGEPSKVYTNGAKYNPSNKTITCDGDQFLTNQTDVKIYIFKDQQ